MFEFPDGELTPVVAEIGSFPALTVAAQLRVKRGMVERGARVVVEIKDRPYGKREGRVRDPFGHLWVLSATIEQLTPSEIERRFNS